MNAHTPFDAKQDWTNPYCQNSSNDPMVDALLGNAYHVVRTVYCNLGNLKLLYDFLNQYGMVLGVQSEAELKALTTKAKYARIYGFSRAGDRQVTDYLYVEGDLTGIIPDDSEATGSWITVATSGSNGSGTSSGEGAYIPWVYANGSATGGETTINVPDNTVGVPFIIINGDMQYVGRGFEFNVDNLSVTLAQPLEEGDEVVFLLTGVPAVPDNPHVNDWVQLNWLYNNGAAVGGEQVIAVPYTFQSVPAVYKNGLRLYKGLTTESYTADPDNQRILLTEPLATNDRLIVQIGGEAQVLEASDHTLQEVARAANVKDSEVILSTDTTQVLNGKKVIYDVVSQRIYGLPTLPTNVYIISVSDGQLTYSPGNITVTLLDSNQQQNTRELWRRSLAEAGLTLVDGSFEEGATANNKTDAVWYIAGGQCYTWDSTFPRDVPAKSTPATTGGVGVGAWLSVGDATLRSDLSTTVSGMGDNIVIHTQSGLTVNAEIENIKAADSEMDNRISVVESFAVSAIKTSVQNLSSVKDSDPAVQYDGFGNTVFWNGRNLFCFRRSPSHLDSVTGKHSACIAEIYKDGSAAVIWEYVPPAGIAAKEPSISVSNPGNQLIIAFTLHDVAADTYKKTIVGYADLNNSGAFTSKSDIVTTDGYYQWGNILTTPDNKFMTSRYSVTGTEVQLITSSDVNLNGSTTWTVTKSFPISLFPGKSLINETCIGYYRGQLVAVIRSSVGSSLSGICLAKTNDTTGANGWSYLQLGFAYAGPRIEAYTDFDDPLIITGTTQRTVTPMYRSDVSMTMTYDLSSFSTSQRIYQGEIFSCYASAKKTTDGSYELISFDEVPDSGVGENLVTKIHRQNFYIAQDNRTKNTVNYKSNWLQSVIKDTPCFGSLAGVSSTVSSSNMYFSFNTAVSGITRIFVMIGPVASPLTITPVLRRADGTTFASFYNVSVPVNARPQIIELVPVNTLAFNIYERLNLNFSSPMPLGVVGGITGIKLPITDRTPFGLYNVVGDTTSPYVAIAFGKL